MKKIKVGVKILPKAEVLDSEGRAIERTLAHHGHAGVQCRVGKYIQLQVDGKDTQDALMKAKEVTEFVLYNPLIEVYELEVYE